MRGWMRRYLLHKVPPIQELTSTSDPLGRAPSQAIKPSFKKEQRAKLLQEGHLGTLKEE